MQSHLAHRQLANRGPHPASCSHQHAAALRRPSVAARATKAKRPAATPLADPMQRAQELMDQGAVSKGVVTGANKGGVIVELEGEAGLRGFMPYTKLAPERLVKPGGGGGGQRGGDYSHLIGSQVRAVVVSVDPQAARGPELVLSERQALAADALARLSPGDVVAGEVTRLEDYGAIVALLNADDGKPMGLQGLVHKKELSWDVVMNVDDAVRVGQRVNVKVLGVDAARRNVSLSLRALQQDPLTETIESIAWRETSEVPAEIVKIVAVLMSTAGISDVRAGRQAAEHSTVAQDLEIYLTKADTPGGFTLVVRSGRVLQELVVATALGRDDMKKALTRVLSRVR